MSAFFESYKKDIQRQQRLAQYNKQFPNASIIFAKQHHIAMSQYLKNAIKNNNNVSPKQRFYLASSQKQADELQKQFYTFFKHKPNYQGVPLVKNLQYTRDLLLLLPKQADANVYAQKAQFLKNRIEKIQKQIVTQISLQKQFSKVKVNTIALAKSKRKIDQRRLKRDEHNNYMKEQINKIQQQLKRRGPQVDQMQQLSAKMYQVNLKVKVPTREQYQFNQMVDLAQVKTIRHMMTVIINIEQKTFSLHRILVVQLFLQINLFFVTCSTKIQSQTNEYTVKGGISIIQLYTFHDTLLQLSLLCYDWASLSFQFPDQIKKQAFMKTVQKLFVTLLYLNAVQKGMLDSCYSAINQMVFDVKHIHSFKASIQKKDQLLALNKQLVIFKRVLSIQFLTLTKAAFYTQKYFIVHRHILKTFRARLQSLQQKSKFILASRKNIFQQLQKKTDNSFSRQQALIRALIYVGLTAARLQTGRIYFLLVCDMTYKMGLLEIYPKIKNTLQAYKIMIKSLFNQDSYYLLLFSLPYGFIYANDLSNFWLTDRGLALITNKIQMIAKFYKASSQSIKGYDSKQNINKFDSFIASKQHILTANDVLMHLNDRMPQIYQNIRQAQIMVKQQQRSHFNVLKRLKQNQLIKQQQKSDILVVQSLTTHKQYQQMKRAKQQLQQLERSVSSVIGSYQKNYIQQPVINLSQTAQVQQYKPLVGKDYGGVAIMGSSQWGVGRSMLKQTIPKINKHVQQLVLPGSKQYMIIVTQGLNLPINDILQQIKIDKNIPILPLPQPKPLNVSAKSIQISKVQTKVLNQMQSKKNQNTQIINKIVEAQLNIKANIEPGQNLIQTIRKQGQVMKQQFNKKTQQIQKMVMQIGKNLVQKKQQTTDLIKKKQLQVKIQKLEKKYYEINQLVLNSHNNKTADAITAQIKNSVQQFAKNFKLDDLKISLQQNLKQPAKIATIQLGKSLNLTLQNVQDLIKSNSESIINAMKNNQASFFAYLNKQFNTVMTGNQKQKVLAKNQISKFGQCLAGLLVKIQNTDKVVQGQLLNILSQISVIDKGLNSYYLMLKQLNGKIDIIGNQNQNIVKTHQQVLKIVDVLSKSQANVTQNFKILSDKWKKETDQNNYLLKNFIQQSKMQSKQIKQNILNVEQKIKMGFQQMRNQLQNSYNKTQMKLQKTQRLNSQKIDSAKKQLQYNVQQLKLYMSGQNKQQRKMITQVGMFLGKNFALTQDIHKQIKQVTLLVTQQNKIQKKEMCEMKMNIQKTSQQFQSLIRVINANHNKQFTINQLGSLVRFIRQQYAQNDNKIAIRDFMVIVGNIFHNKGMNVPKSQFFKRTLQYIQQISRIQDQLKSDQLKGKAKTTQYQNKLKEKKHQIDLLSQQVKSNNQKIQKLQQQIVYQKQARRKSYKSVSQQKLMTQKFENQAKLRTANTQLTALKKTYAQSVKRYETKETQLVKVSSQYQQYMKKSQAKKNQTQQKHVQTINSLKFNLSNIQTQLQNLQKKTLIDDQATKKLVNQQLAYQKAFQQFNNKHAELFQQRNGLIGQFNAKSKQYNALQQMHYVLLQQMNDLQLKYDQQVDIVKQLADPRQSKRIQKMTMQFERIKKITRQLQQVIRSQQYILNKQQGEEIIRQLTLRVAQNNLYNNKGNKQQTSQLQDLIAQCKIQIMKNQHLNKIKHSKVHFYSSKVVTVNSIIRNFIFKFIPDQQATQNKKLISLRDEFTQYYKQYQKQLKGITKNIYLIQKLDKYIYAQQQKLLQLQKVNYGSYNQTKQKYAAQFADREEQIKQLKGRRQRLHQLHHQLMTIIKKTMVGQYNGQLQLQNTKKQLQQKQTQIQSLKEAQKLLKQQKQDLQKEVKDLESKIKKTTQQNNKKLVKTKQVQLKNQTIIRRNAQLQMKLMNLTQTKNQYQMKKKDQDFSKIVRLDVINSQRRQLSTMMTDICKEVNKEIVELHKQYLQRQNLYMGDNIQFQQLQQKHQGYLQSLTSFKDYFNILLQQNEMLRKQKKESQMIAGGNDEQQDQQKKKNSKIKNISNQQIRDISSSAVANGLKQYIGQKMEDELGRQNDDPNDDKKGKDRKEIIHILQNIILKLLEIILKMLKKMKGLVAQCQLAIKSVTNMKQTLGADDPYKAQMFDDIIKLFLLLQDSGKQAIEIIKNEDYQKLHSHLSINHQHALIIIEKLRKGKKHIT